MKKLVVIATIVLLPSIALATFSLKLDNNTGKKMVYMLYWIDHHYDWPYPFNMAGGELQARQTVDLRENLQTGEYCVIWSNKEGWQNKVMLNVNDTVKSVTVTPIKSRMKP
jgi:hypothetical protein